MLTFYTNKFIPTGSAGCTRGPVIFIRPEYKGDKGLLAHEEVHRWQWVFTLGLHSVLYLMWKKYRLAVEVIAYRRQIAVGALSAEKAAGFLSKKYRLNITEADAIASLRG